MALAELLLIAVGLSMDAFAVAVCKGLGMRKVTFRRALIVGLYFGVFQAGMPLLGYLLASQFSDAIQAYDHYIAFGLLFFICAKMALGSFRQQGCADRECPEGVCSDRDCPNGHKPGCDAGALRPSQMLPMALATSVDALAVGITFAFLQVEMLPAAALIGSVTLLLSMAGVMLGRVCGARFRARAELAGGILLILMGIKILVEHLTAGG